MSNITIATLAALPVLIIIIAIGFWAVAKGKRLNEQESNK